MSVAEFSLDGLADSLIGQLDRNKIFPPHHNNPEEFVLDAHSKNKMPKRSPNAFLLCRKNVHKEAKRVGVCNMRVISKVTGILWRNSSLEEKEVYEELAKHIREIYIQRDNAANQYNNQPHLHQNFQHLQQQHYVVSNSYMPYSIPIQIPPLQYHNNNNNNNNNFHSHPSSLHHPMSTTNSNNLTSSSSSYSSSSSSSSSFSSSPPIYRYNNNNFAYDQYDQASVLDYWSIFRSNDDNPNNYSNDNSNDNSNDFNFH
ncbi:hypothetical protein Glove_130g122 [Diversispora epigaea]|uniref:HMG box domain-containing protein n=1 Tax=Diversispora epigaea TaxID=1348612 RepID=A0A397J0U3_9GLOM|nr:hypothetical protein Glove_130g122 [Diversispora epigaea]